MHVCLSDRRRPSSPVYSTLAVGHWLQLKVSPTGTIRRVNWLMKWQARGF
jgi:hypothetical protein